MKFSLGIHLVFLMYNSIFSLGNLLFITDSILLVIDGRVLDTSVVHFNVLTMPMPHLLNLFH